VRHACGRRVVSDSRVGSGSRHATPLTKHRALGCTCRQLAPPGYSTDGPTRQRASSQDLLLQQPSVAYVEWNLKRYHRRLQSDGRLHLLVQVRLITPSSNRPVMPHIIVTACGRIMAGIFVHVFE